MANIPHHIIAERKSRAQKRREAAEAYLRIAVLLLVFASLWAYQLSFTVPFFFDDEPSIFENKSIQTLWPPWQPLWPSAVSSVQGRPVANFTLAVNYALGGFHVWGYHLLNWLLHLGTGLLVLGLTRRLLESPRLSRRYGPAAKGLALSLALLWIVHPLNSEAVVYVTQRTELLMAFFYLLTLYMVTRGIRQPSGQRLWYSIAIAACIMGMGSKEVMVSAPLVAVLMDRVFFSPSWKMLWRKRGMLYAGLASSWLLLGFFVFSFPRQGVVGWHFPELTPSAYAGTQFGVILHYLRLVVWPHPLVVYYDWPIARTAQEILPSGFIIATLLSATVLTWRRRPAISFLGMCFWLGLAPTSSVLPIYTEIAADRRMYLPSIAVLALLIVGVWHFLRKLLRGRSAHRKKISQVSLVTTAAIVLTTMTLLRTVDYTTEERIWTDAISKQPHSHLVHNNLGKALHYSGRLEEAIHHYEQAVNLNPEYAIAHSNWGAALDQLDRNTEAMVRYKTAIHFRPDYASAHNNLAALLCEQDRCEESVDHLKEALRLKPDYVIAHLGLSAALKKVGRRQEALKHARQAVRLDPHSSFARITLALILAEQGWEQEALTAYTAALELSPGWVTHRAELIDALELGKRRRKTQTAEGTL